MRIPEPRITLLDQCVAHGGATEVGLLSGYNSFRLRSDNELSCDLWLDETYQSRIDFNLRTLPADAVVRNAKLRFTIETVALTDQPDFKVTDDCKYEAGAASASAVREPGEAPVRAMTPYQLTQPDSAVTVGLDAVANELDVTRSVFAGVNGRGGNLGFLISPDEDLVFREHDDPDDVQYCGGYVTGLALEVV